MSEEDGEWRLSNYLQVGDLLRTASGDWKPILEIEVVQEKRATYNFGVTKNHNYFVGEKSWLVHNQCNPIARINVAELPANEANSVMNTVNHIDAGTKAAGALSKKWGTEFKNHQGNLPGTPGAGGYQEFRVANVKGTDPGTFRVVKDVNTGSLYYTWTYYGDTGKPAFVQIR